MALLVYSDKCRFSGQLMEYIKTQPSLNEVIRYHNVTTLGVPSKKITKVPTLVTNEGVMKVGGDIKPWLESMIPFEFDAWDASAGLCSSIDGTENSSLFEFDNFGQQLQPEITPELEAKISSNITDAMAKLRTSNT
jgi:hypothetical protein